MIFKSRRPWRRAARGNFNTVKSVCNDHLYNKSYYLWFIQKYVLMITEGTKLLVLTISAFWSSSRWPLATYMSYSRQKSIPLSGLYRQVSLYKDTVLINKTPVDTTYTLGKKGCYTPIEDNKTNVDRTFVFPLGWNWHDMDPWLFPNEIRHYLGQTFNARSSGIVELRNHSIGGRSPKSIFTLWQLWINICIFFRKFFWLLEQCPVQSLWV